MKLTKEECKRALNVITCRNETGQGIENIYTYLKPEIDCLMELINEHFDESENEKTRVIAKITFDEDKLKEIAEDVASKIYKAFKLYVEWTTECDFGYDNIPEEYEKYKEYIKDMSYNEGLIYIAMQEVEE